MSNDTKVVRPAPVNVNARRQPLSPSKGYTRDIPRITQADAASEKRKLFEEQELPADLPDARTFGRGPARRPAPQVSDPLLQWASGLPTKDRQIYAGWLIEAGKLEALDLAMNDAHFKQVTIKHGGGNLVTHWAVETANVFVVCEGVQSITEMRDTPERYGIAFGWRPVRTEGGGLRAEYRGGNAHSPLSPQSSALKMQSQLKCRVYLQELLAVGYQEPLLLSVKSTLTGDLISALIRQYDVLDAIDRLRAEDGKPPLNPPFYACSIPLGPGQEVARGSGSQTKEITPMVARVPEVVTKEYVLAHWCKKAWAQLIESRLDDTVRWSVRVSEQIGSGEEPREEWES